MIIFLKSDIKKALVSIKTTNAYTIIKSLIKDANNSATEPLMSLICTCQRLT